MELHRYDIIEAELDYGSGSIQKKRRPYISPIYWTLNYLDIITC